MYTIFTTLKKGEEIGVEKEGKGEQKERHNSQERRRMKRREKKGKSLGWASVRRSKR